MSKSAGNLNSNGANAKLDNAMSDGELSSETETMLVQNQNQSADKQQVLKVEKTSADFFDSSCENKSEGELSDPELAPSHESTDRDNPWTQAAMGNYPALPVSRETVQVWNEYYTQAMEQVKLSRKRKGQIGPQGKNKKRKTNKALSPKKEAVEDKIEIQEVPSNHPLAQESDESSDFELEEREERVTLSDVISQSNHIDLAVFAGEDQETLKGKRTKLFLQGPKKRKRKKRYGRANNIRQECKQEYWSQDKFRSTVMQPQFCVDTTVCMYWKMYGYCNKGDACGYSHLPQLKGVAPPTKRIPDVCKFYLQDSCQKGTNCNYYHQDFPCKFFHIGLTCYQGNGCKFSHAPLNEETSKLLEKAWSASKPRTLSRDTDLPPEPQGPALYSAVPPEEQQSLPAFSLPSPPPAGPMRFPRPSMDPTVLPQRYSFSIFEPPRPQMIPHQFPYRPSRPYLHMNPRFPPVPFPRAPNRFPSCVPREPTPPSYQPISYESDEPGQPPVSPLSFLSDDTEERVLTIDAGEFQASDPGPTILSPKHPNIDLLFQRESPPLSRSDSAQSDPRLRKGSKRGSLSDTPDSFCRSLSLEGLGSPDLFSDPPDIPAILSPDLATSPQERKPTLEDLQFEMPLPLRDPAALTKPLDPRVLFQNVAKKADLSSDAKLTV